MFHARRDRKRQPRLAGNQATQSLWQSFGRSKTGRVNSVCATLEARRKDLISVNRPISRCHTCRKNRSPKPTRLANRRCNHEDFPHRRFRTSGFVLISLSKSIRLGGPETSIGPIG